jgi:two-component system cell cycle sensor histidine kinase/response regulator CckA
VSRSDESRARGIRQLAGGVAHDFNNLLVVISGLAELALERQSTGAAPRNELERIQRAAKRADELTRALLAVACRQALRPREIDLNQTLAVAHERLKGIVGEQIELHIVPGADVPRILLDPNQLDRILEKLAESARHRMPDGGSCEFETRAMPATGSRRRPHSRVHAQLTVTDTGPSLDADSRSRIFEPYYNPTGEAPLGLALAMIEGIVTQSGGRCRVRSRKGSGTCFELLLPAATSPSGDDGRPR